MKIELGALSFTIKVENGEMCYPFPRLDVLQDNIKEVIKEIPNGEYKWVLVLDLDKAEKVNE